MSLSFHFLLDSSRKGRYWSPCTIPCSTVWVWATEWTLVWMHHKMSLQVAQHRECFSANIASKTYIYWQYSFLLFLFSQEASPKFFLWYVMCSSVMCSKLQWSLKNGFTFSTVKITIRWDSMKKIAVVLKLLLARIRWSTSSTDEILSTWMRFLVLFYFANSFEHFVATFNRTTVCLFSHVDSNNVNIHGTFRGKL